MPGPCFVMQYNVSIISMGERGLVVLVSLSSCCRVAVSVL